MNDKADDKMVHVELYTDGACSGNPGPGGWAFILRHPESGKAAEVSGGAAETTNNQMELTAVIEGLQRLTKPSRVDIYSDSQYVLNGLKTWIDDWKKKGWRRGPKGNQTVKNLEMWKQLDRLREKHDLQYHWIRGHSEHPENERCDALAVAEAAKYKKAAG